MTLREKIRLLVAQLWRGENQVSLTISISPEARKFFRDPDFVITGHRTMPYPDEANPFC